VFKTASVCHRYLITLTDRQLRTEYKAIRHLALLAGKPIGHYWPYAEYLCQYSMVRHLNMLAVKFTISYQEIIRLQGNNRRYH
jgi:hypothetical protein